MNEIITCTVLGIASIALGDVQTNPSGRETWTGVRLRTDAGKVRFLKGMMVEPEAALIIRAGWSKVSGSNCGSPARMHAPILTGSEPPQRNGTTTATAAISQAKPSNS